VGERRDVEYRLGQPQDLAEQVSNIPSASRLGPLPGVGPLPGLAAGLAARRGGNGRAQVVVVRAGL
jgi:hypothetical protein